MRWLGRHHSNSLEVHFVHTPGLKVVYPSTPANAKALLKASIRDDNPVMFLEHEGLYNLEGDVPDEVEPGAIGRAEVVRKGADVTIVAYGAMTHVALEAAEKLAGESVEAEVIDLLTLRPWDKETVAASVARTHRAVVVEEARPVCGIAAEVAANVYEMVFDALDAPIRRVSGADVPAPYARELEQACIPHAIDVVEAVRATIA